MNELRVFISSTFRDLQEEREYLVKKVFPEIRAVCRQRGVTFTEVDLRWGLTEEEGALGRIIRICLEEVDRCKPYFIGLLGSNYGWIPDAHDVYIDAELLARYAWVERAVLQGTSLTELEFIQGVFSSPRPDSRHAFFYHRQGLLEESDDSKRLQELIERTKETGLPFREFRRADELGAFVRDDLIAMIDAFWPIDAAPSPLETEHRVHMAFAASRMRAYIPQPEYLRAVNRWFEEETRPLVIAGSSGMGKSALIAHTAEVLRARHPDAFVVEHYVGASDASATVTGLIRHVIEAIRGRFGIDDPVPTSREEIEQSLGMWFHRLAQEAGDRNIPAIVSIDALNQLEVRAQTLLWLPETIPAGMKLMLSTTPGTAEGQLAKRDWVILPMTPIQDERVRQSIIVRYLGEFRKGIASDHLRRLASNDKSSSPLFLRVVAEELRLHGEHETVAEVVIRYVEAADIDEVFQLVLERMERDFGAKSVADLLGLLGASRSGLSEHELLGIMRISRVELSRLLFALDYHLIRRDGLLGFFHDYLRQAVTARYLPDKETGRHCHRRIAAYFAGTTYGARCRDEEPWGWKGAEEWDRLADCLADPEILVGLNTRQRSYELISYWRALEGRYDPSKVYSDRLVNARKEGWTADRRADYADAVGQYFTESGKYSEAEPLLRLVHRYRRRANGPDDERIVVVLEHLATALYHQGKYSEAELLWSDALQLLEGAFGTENPRLCPTLDSLAASAWRRGAVADIEKQCRRSLAIAE